MTEGNDQPRHAIVEFPDRIHEANTAHEAQGRESQGKARVRRTEGLHEGDGRGIHGRRGKLRPRARPGDCGSHGPPPYVDRRGRASKTVLPSSSEKILASAVIM
jgi:hypothetical protein